MNNKEFIDALNQLALERNIDKDQLLTSFEEALTQAYERNVEPGKEIEVNVTPGSGEIEVLVVRRVVEVIEDEDKEISLQDALEHDEEIEVGMEMEFPVDHDKFTRIAVQTAKQVITQKIREAERQVVFEEYKDRTGEIITATVTRVDNKRNVFVDLGRGEAIMPPKEQIPTERYQVGMRVKVYISKVEFSNRGPSILVSRASPELLQYLMRQEIPEVSDETVEIKAIAREAGQRSKVAVTSNNPNVDPIGACIGHKGARIQAITNELQRERVDIIPWDPNPREFIRNALSPAKVGLVEISSGGEDAKVTVTNDQLSLAIGKGGQNVRLAAKLTDFKIDLATGEHISDLDAALQAAATSDEFAAFSAPKAADEKRAAFEALFTEMLPKSDTAQKQDAEANPDADADATQDDSGASQDAAPVNDEQAATDASAAKASAFDEAFNAMRETSEPADPKAS